MVQTIILGMKGKMEWLSTILACCMDCGAVFNIQRRWAIITFSGYDTSYWGIDCPVCGSKLAVTQDWILPEMSEKSAYNAEWEEIVRERRLM